MKCGACVLLTLHMLFLTVLCDPLTEVKTLPGEQIVFQMISSFAVDHDGSIFFLDPRYCSLIICDPAGRLKRRVPLTLSYPKDIQIVRDRLYILDSRHEQVSVFTKDGSHDSTLELEHRLNHPSALFYDGSRLLISDYGNSRIIERSLFSESAIELEDFSAPHSLWADSTKIVCADWRRNRIHVFDRKNTQIPFTFGRTGLDGEGFFHIDGLVCAGGFIFVSDWGNNQLKIFTEQGKLVYATSRKSLNLRNPSVLRYEYPYLYLLDSNNLMIRVLEVDFSELERLRQ
ncbi:MAG: hypothetical protein PHQ23_17635 [Candidatus Wallbacteria bacterium]|nr:hypothetical protein [Candidatus Wallbacteria bacterium]